MKNIIERIAGGWAKIARYLPKAVSTRLAVAALAALAAGGAWAATVTGYEDFGDVAGVVLYRATQTTFHNSTVINVADDGTPGTAYAMDAGNNNTTSWKRFASNQGASCYTSPGTVLVYDEAGSYTVESDAQFGPMSFGGIWVKSLAANDAVFAIKGSGDRKTEFGAADKTTLFKFDKSFKIDRQGTFSFLGTVNLAVAQDAVFTINPSYLAQSIVVASGSTLAPSGAGTITLNAAGLTVNGTLDLTASTLPTISGNVRFASGSSLVLPAGVATGEAISVAVCSGALTADGVVSVKIGTADPINAALTISGGAITQIDEAVVEQTFTSGYPSVVPAGYIYTFTASAATTLSSVTVNGTLKTEGDFTITDLTVAASGALDVVSGNTTVGGTAAKQLSGNITVRSGATLTNTLTDSLNYSGSMTVDIYGTLAMGSTRWSIPDGCTFKVHGGATVTGSGDGYGVLDFLAANDRGLDVYAASSASSVTIEGAVRVRNNLTRIWVAGNTTLVLQGGIVEKNQQPGSFKQTGPGTLELAATSTSLTGTSQMTQGTLRLNNTTRAFPLELHGSASLEIVATDAATTVPVNVTSINGNGVTLTGNGKANGTITKTAAPSGDLATFLQSSAWEGTFVADWAGANGTRFDINSYGNANSTVRVTKLVGGYVSGSNANVTVVPTVEVSGFMTLDNGYSGKVTTLTKLTGSGVFTNKTYSVDVTTLDNFTGTLATLIGTQYIGMRIGTINLSSTPAAGAKIVNVTSDSNIGNIGNTKVSVNGVVDDTIALEVKSDGIYVAVAPYVAEYNGVPYETVQAAIDAAEQAGQTYANVTILDPNATCPAGYYVDTDNSNALTKCQAAIIQNNAGVISTNYFKTAQLAVDAIEANVLAYINYTHFEVYSGTAVEIAINPSATAWDGFSVKVKCLNGATVAVTLDSTEYELTEGDADANGIVTYTKSEKPTTYVWTGNTDNVWNKRANWAVGTASGATASRSPSSVDTAAVNGSASITVTTVSVAGLQVSGAVTFTGVQASITSASPITLGANDTISLTDVTLSPTPTTTVANSYVKLTGSTYSVATVQNASISDVTFDYYASYTNADVTATVGGAGTYTLTVQDKNYVANAESAGTVTFENVDVSNTELGSGVAYTITATGAATGGTSGTSEQKKGTVVDGSGWMLYNKTATGVGSWADGDGAAVTPVYGENDYASFSGTNIYAATGVSTGDVVTVSTVVAFGGAANPAAAVDPEAQAALRINAGESGNTFQVYTAGPAWVDVGNDGLGAPEDEQRYTVGLRIDYGVQKFYVTIGKDETVYSLTNAAGVSGFDLAKGASGMRQVQYNGSGSFVSIEGANLLTGYMADVGTEGNVTNVAVSADFVSEYLAGEKASAVQALISPTAERTCDNGLNYFESYALGLNPTSKNDAPIVNAAPTSEGKIELSLTKANGDAITPAGNVDVDVAIKEGSNDVSGQTSGEGAGKTIVIDPASLGTGVHRFKAEIGIGAK